MDRREEEETEHEGSSIDKYLELIPLDLIPEILLRLPAKAAVRFRVVSKLWSSITTCPGFIRSFAFQSSTRLCLLACVKTRHKRLFISLHQHDDASYTHVDRCLIKSPELEYGSYYEPCSQSVKGLLCFGDLNRIVVWNPAMRQHVTLPEIEPEIEPKAMYIRSCLGYDPVEDKYKVLCMSGKRHRDPLVFTLGPQESWRVIQNSPSHIPLPTMGPLGICINGHVYYEAEMRFKVDDTFEYENILMSFELRFEKFNTIKKPPARPYLLSHLMLNYQGKLAWVCSGLCFGFHSIILWVLEDEEKQEWSLRNFLLPFPLFLESDPIFECKMQLCGVTHDTGEFILTATTFEAFYVLYYDPKTKRERRIEYEGIGDKEFWIRNEILYDNYCITHWFPNHSETLMSLDNVPRLSAGSWM